MLFLSQETEKEQALHDTQSNFSKTSQFEVSLADLIKFFVLNGKFIGIVTALLSPLAIWLCLQLPRPYQTQLTLLVKFKYVPGLYSSPPSRLSEAAMMQSFVFLNPQAVHAFAFSSLQQLKLAQTTIAPTYTNDPQKINVVLQSTNPEALRRASSQVASQLLKKFITPVQEILAVNRQATEIDIQKNKQVLTQLERQNAKVGQKNPVKSAALETQISQQMSTLAALEFDKNYLQQREQQLLDFTAKLISIKVVTASEIKLSRSPRQLIAIAIVSSFLVAVLAATYRQLIREKAMSCARKPKVSKDV